MYQKERFERENGIELTKLDPFHTTVVTKDDEEIDDYEERDDVDDILSQINAVAELNQKKVQNVVPDDQVQKRKVIGGEIVDFGENCWRDVAQETKKGIHIIGKMSAGK